MSTETETETETETQSVKQTLSSWNCFGGNQHQPSHSCIVFKKENGGAGDNYFRMSAQTMENFQDFYPPSVISGGRINTSLSYFPTGSAALPGGSMRIDSHYNKNGAHDHKKTHNLSFLSPSSSSSSPSPPSNCSSSFDINDSGKASRDQHGGGSISSMFQSTEKTKSFSSSLPHIIHCTRTTTTTKRSSADFSSEKIDTEEDDTPKQIFCYQENNKEESFPSTSRNSHHDAINTTLNNVSFTTTPLLQQEQNHSNVGKMTINPNSNTRRSGSGQSYEYVDQVSHFCISETSLEPTPINTSGPGRIQVVENIPPLCKLESFCHAKNNKKQAYYAATTITSIKSSSLNNLVGHHHEEDRLYQYDNDITDHIIKTFLHNQQDELTTTTTTTRENKSRQQEHSEMMLSSSQYQVSEVGSNVLPSSLLVSQNSFLPLWEGKNKKRKRSTSDESDNNGSKRDGTAFTSCCIHHDLSSKTNATGLLVSTNNSQINKTVNITALPPPQEVITKAGTLKPSKKQCTTMNSNHNQANSISTLHRADNNENETVPEDERNDETTNQNSHDMNNVHHHEENIKRFRDYQAEQWWQRYQDLIVFQQTCGHCNVPNEFPQNRNLSQWVKRQRYQYKLKQDGKHSTLTDKRESILQSMGFIWDSHKALWMERWNELKTFYDAVGHSNVPTNYAKNHQLAIWVKCQRRQYKLFMAGDPRSNMSLERISKLESLNFVWHPKVGAKSAREKEMYAPPL